jgi:hypothetical protein
MPHNPNDLGDHHRYAERSSEIAESERDLVRGHRRAPTVHTPQTGRRSLAIVRSYLLPRHIVAVPLTI